MKKKESVERRILNLEKSLGLNRTGNRIAGTSLARVLTKPPGVGTQWCLSVGLLMDPKVFFYGPTIANVLGQAEIAVRGDSCASSLSDRSFDDPR